LGSEDEAKSQKRRREERKTDESLESLGELILGIVIFKGGALSSFLGSFSSSDLW